jgi:hypothetical protein
LWASLLKERTTYERAKLVARQKHLNKREELMDMQLAAINRCDADSQKMLVDAKDLYTSTEAQADALIKQEEDLTVCMHAFDERERVVEELEDRLLEREQLDSLNLGRELESLEAHEHTLHDGDSTLEVEHKAPLDAPLTIMAHELAADVREGTWMSER